MEESLETHPISTVTPESVRVSRRLQIKREKRAGKRKLVKINLKTKVEAEEDDDGEVDLDFDREDFIVEAFDDDQDDDYIEDPADEKPIHRPRKKRKVVADKKSSGVVTTDRFSLSTDANSSNRKRKKVFDYESALNELREMQERQKVVQKRPQPPPPPKPTSVETSFLMPDFITPRLTRPSTIQPKRWLDAAVQTDHTGSVSGGGNQYAILKNNVDLKWANDKLLKENAALKARVNILLDMLVQKTSQLKLLKMACIDGKQNI